MKALIVGAGIGGLTTALTLQDIGIETVVLEQATALGDVGAGIQLAPNATRVLRHVGALEPLLPFAVHPADLTFRTWSDGTVIARRLLGPKLEETLGAPYIQVHRADLQAALVNALGTTPRLSAAVVEVEQDGQSATAILKDGSKVSADFLIGADGIRSAVRVGIFGEENVEYSGTVSYRAVVPADRLAGLDLPPNASWLGPGKHLVNYWIRGGALMNVVPVVRAPVGDESWSAEVDPAEALRLYTGWDPRVISMLEAVDTLFRRGIYTRQPLKSWSVGRIALLGDSAHAMVPFHAQGAAQSIVDAAVLARCLTGVREPDVAAALRAYADARIDKANDVQTRSDDQGHLYHVPDGPESAERNRVMAEAVRRQPFGDQFDVWSEDVYAPCAGARRPVGENDQA